MTSRDVTSLDDMRVFAIRALSHLENVTKDQFLTNELVQDAVFRCLIVIGEAAGRVSADTRRRLPDIDWSGVVGLRNIVVHQYHRLRYETVWEAVQRDVPKLLTALIAHLGEATQP